VIEMSTIEIMSMSRQELEHFCIQLVQEREQLRKELQNLAKAHFTESLALETELRRVKDENKELKDCIEQALETLRKFHQINENTALEYFCKEIVFHQEDALREIFEGKKKGDKK
jgi:hypothetical protein